MNINALAVVVSAAVAGTAQGGLVVTSVTGTIRSFGNTIQSGFDSQDFDHTASIFAVGETATVIGEAESGTAHATASATATVAVVPQGFRTISIAHTEASTGSGGPAAGNAVGHATTDITVLFSLDAPGPIAVTGRFSGVIGGRSYYGNGGLMLFNPAGTLVLRSSALAGGSSLDQVVAATMTGEYRLVFTASADAVDYGGGGFSGGIGTGSIDIIVSAVPGPGATTLVAFSLIAAARRRR